MNGLVKYLGIILVIIGALVLIIPYFAGVIISNNTLLIIAICLFVAGLLTHIIINKKIV
jgi:hypothetical protein